MNEQTLELFKQLTEFPAVSGFERELRELVKEKMSAYTSEFVQDRLGSLFGVIRGDEAGPKIMVAGHFDEVGFMVSGITDQGLVRFQTLGGWSNQVVLAQRLHIVTDQGTITGVVGSTPVHLLSQEERSKAVDIRNMYIDIGADDRAEAEAMGIRPGLQIVPVCEFTPMANPKKIMAKAWDNRYGVGLAIELLEALHKQPLGGTVYSGATVQEELGLRGARTATQLIQPDIFFGLDCSAANDMTGDRNAFGHIGKGALLRIYDPTMFTHRGMVEYIQDTASTNKIPVQYYISQGGTDAGAVHLSGIGIPSSVIGICGRYIHTSSSIIHTDDYDAAKELLIKLVKGMNASTYRTLIERA